jgi:hypothetical protein
MSSLSFQLWHFFLADVTFCVKLLSKMGVVLYCIRVTNAKSSTIKVL